MPQPCIKMLSCHHTLRACHRLLSIQVCLIHWYQRRPSAHNKHTAMVVHSIIMSSACGEYRGSEANWDAMCMAREVLLFVQKWQQNL